MSVGEERSQLQPRQVHARHKAVLRGRPAAGALAQGGGLSTPSPGGRVCFYSDYAYPLIARRPIEFAGGAESQVVRLARGLAGVGYEVSMVTCDYGQPPIEVIDGVRVLRTYRPNHGIRGLRFVHPRLSLATAGLWRADADVYYVCGAGMAAGLTSEVAGWRRAGFVLAMMSDYDVLPRPPQGSGRTQVPWFHRALRRADRLLAQTAFQQSQLESNFGLRSEVFPNIVDLPEVPIDPGHDGVVLWIATYKRIKRPEWFIQLARELPRYRFVMSGVVPPPPLTQEAWDEALEASRALPNLEVHGFVEGEALEALRRRAALVVHTSPVEGFSNVLLESWAAGLPTVSGVDPDGLVTREGIGRFAADYPEFVDAVRGYMADPEARRDAGRRARRYAEREHAPEVVFRALSGVLDPLIERTRTRRRQR